MVDKESNTIQEGEDEPESWPAEVKVMTRISRVHQVASNQVTQVREDERAFAKCFENSRRHKVLTSLSAGETNSAFTIEGYAAAILTDKGRVPIVDSRDKSLIVNKKIAGIEIGIFDWKR